MSVTDARFEGQRDFQSTQKQNREEENVSEIYFNGSRQLLIITRSHGRDNGVRLLIVPRACESVSFVSFFYYYEKTIASTERTTTECAVLSLDSNEFIAAVLVANFFSVV